MVIALNRARGTDDGPLIGRRRFEGIAAHEGQRGRFLLPGQFSQELLQVEPVIRRRLP
ncbi:hypothetical protein ACLBKS_12935 [Hylemonella sp. W303a]|uniref:hypothetical protein n=1 Tax=Hylemonella sp. W303a TaxID=3389873 RepID=UPI00396B3E05